MELDDIRKSINNIDDKMKDLFYERLECSGRVAEYKIDNGGEVFRPEREREIENRLSDGGGLYLPFVKKVIQISRKYQYGRITDNISNNNKTWDSAFTGWLIDNSPDNLSTLQDGGELTLFLKGDLTGDEGLSIKDIISIISDTTLTVRSLSCGCRENTVSVVLSVGDNEADIFEARILAYMLYKESITI